MATEYINVRLTRKVYDQIRKFEKKKKLDPSISQTVQTLLDNFDEFAYVQKEVV